MNAAATKTQTANGKQFAPFTLVVNFKPEYQLPNPQTGEIKEKWWYRCDVEAKKYFNKTGCTIARQADILGKIYSENRHKFTQAEFYNNKTGKLFLRFVNGKMDFPKLEEQKFKANQWLINCAK